MITISLDERGDVTKETIRKYIERQKVK